MNNNTQDQNEAVINSLLETIASRNKEISALTVSLSSEHTFNEGTVKTLLTEIERLKELVSIKSDLAASYIEQAVVLEGEVSKLEGLNISSENKITMLENMIAVLSE